MSRGGDKNATGAAEVPGPVLRCLADVEPREVQWLWPGRVPLGRISLLVGRPGEGKSFLTTDMTAHVSTGRTWPDGSACPCGSVILVSAEDDPHDTIRPRLDAHGADVRRVHLLATVRRRGEGGRLVEAMFTLEDLPALAEALDRQPDCRLIVIDPIGSFIGGGTDSHRGQRGPCRARSRGTVGGAVWASGADRGAPAQERGHDRRRSGHRQQGVHGDRSRGVASHARHRRQAAATPPEWQEQPRARGKPAWRSTSAASRRRSSGSQARSTCAPMTRWPPNPRVAAMAAHSRRPRTSCARNWPTAARPVVT